MTVVELPSNDGKIIAVNPHHVSACQAYTGYLSGRTDRQEMTAVWVGGNVYVCAWRIEQTVDVLNQGRHRDAAAFEAGYRAGVGRDDINRADMARSFLAWITPTTHDTPE